MNRFYQGKENSSFYQGKSIPEKNNGHKTLKQHNVYRKLYAGQHFWNSELWDSEFQSQAGSGTEDMSKVW